MVVIRTKRQAAGGGGKEEEISDPQVVGSQPYPRHILSAGWSRLFIICIAGKVA